jgi:HEAT repeat protein
MKLNTHFFTRILLSSVAAVSLVAGRPAFAAAGPPSPNVPESESKLIEVLKSSAPPEEKAITCKKLAVYGSKACVPLLAPLLESPELNSWARIALEAIPDSACDDALRTALGKVQGRMLVGVINSIGHRRDAQAVSGLVPKLKDSDKTIACAAANALGNIGSDQAGQALEQALSSAPDAVRSEVAYGCVLCAERFLASGKATQATHLYDLVRKANVPKQRILEATRGAILARQTAGLPLLLEQLRSSDRALFVIGLCTARELPGTAATEALAAELERTDLERQTALVMVLADRNDPAALPAVRKAAQGGQKKLRLAAITALDRMGNPSTVPLLLDIAAENDPELAQASRVALARLAGKEVDQELLKRLPQAAGKMRAVLIELAGQRQVPEALPVILKSAEDTDASVRSAAFSAIGALGDENQAASLVQLLEKAKGSKDQGDIEKSLLAIGNRRGVKCQPSLMPLMQHSDANLRKVGMHTLSSVGGPAALAAVKAAMNDKDESVQDEAVRTLSAWPSSWPEDAGVAEPLLTLARTGKKNLHKVLGLRGYLQYLAGDKKMVDLEKVTQVTQLMPQIQRPEEKRLAILAVSAAPAAGALELLMTLAADDAVVEEACLAITTVAPRGEMQGVPREVRAKALQIVLDKSKVDRTRTKAENALKRFTGKR